MVGRLRLLILFLLRVAVARASGAQAASVRLSLAAWSDSLARIADPSALPRASLASRTTGDAGDLRLAAYQLREGELTNDANLLQRVLIRLDAVAAAHRDWPAPEVLIARAFRTLSDSNAPMKFSAGLIPGASYAEAMWRHLQYAFAVDPAFEPARAFALDVLTAEGDRTLRGEERAVLRKLLASAHPEADAYLVAGRDARDRLRYDSALVWFDQALASGGDRSVLGLERARTLKALGRDTAAGLAYWNGLDHLTPAGRVAYRVDFAWIRTPDEMRAFDAVAGDSLGHWVKHFWAERDAESAGVAGAELQEHLRRWVYAFAHYRVEIPWRRNQFNRVEYGFEGLDYCVGNDSMLYDLLAAERVAYPHDVRHREALLDHRGLIYLRHGAPFRSIGSQGILFDSDTMHAGSAPAPDSLPTFAEEGYCIKNGFDTGTGWAIGPNEAWMYWIDGGWRILNFRGSCALGTYGATTLTSYLPVSNSTIGDWLARAPLSPEYHDAAMRIYIDLSTPQRHEPETCQPEVRTVIASSRTDAAVAVRRDSYTPRIARPWNAVIQAFAVGSARDHDGEILVTFAIPVDSLHRVIGSDGTPVYPVRTRLSGFDRASGQTFTIDTVRDFAAPPAGTAHRDAYLTGSFTIPAASGDWVVGARMNQGVDSIGTFAEAPSLVIPAGDTLAMSDVVSGVAGGFAWNAPDRAVFPVNALGAWRAGSSAELYFELRGLDAGVGYHTVIELRTLDARSRDLIRIESSDRATGPTTTVRKTLGLALVKPGDYRLTVTITAGTRSVTRDRRILIVRK